MKRVVAVQVALLAAAVWLVVLSRRREHQVFGPSFAHHLRVTAMALSVACIAAFITWVAARIATAALATSLGLAGLAVVVGAGRRPALPAGVTIAVDMVWLAGPAAVLAVMTSTGVRALSTVPSRWILRAVVATAVAAAVCDGGVGLRSTIGALSASRVPPLAQVALAAHVVALGAAAFVVVGWSIRRSAADRTFRAFAAVWALVAFGERLLPLLPVTSFRDTLVGTYRPWAMVLGVHLPLMASGGLIAVIGWSLVVRPRAATTPTGALVLRARDPVASLRDDLAAWLGDPTLELAFADGLGRWVSPTKGEVQPESGRYDRISTMVTEQGRPVVMLSHDMALSADRHGLVTAATLAGFALEANRVLGVSEGRLVDAQRLSQRLLQADSTTRAEVNELLENGPLARLRGCLGVLRAGGAVEGVVPELRAATKEVRTLSHGLHPAELIDGGLSAALAGRVGVPLRRLPAAIELTAYLLAVDDPSATFEDSGSILRVHCHPGVLSKHCHDRLSVLGAAVGDLVIELPIEED